LRLREQWFYLLENNVMYYFEILPAFQGNMSLTFRRPRNQRDDVTGDWRKLHNDELHNLYSSPNKIRMIKSRRMRWAGHVARMGETRDAYRILVGKPEGKIQLGRPRRRWGDNIKMDLREIGCDGRDWIEQAQDRDQ
jgi:hypothetical protein